MATRTFGVLAVSSILLLGCAASQEEAASNEGMGTAAGAVVGGLIGAALGDGDSRVIAIVAGAAIGGILGNRIGAALDEQDRAAMEAEAAKSLDEAEDGQTIVWNNPDSGASAELTPRDTKSVQKQVQIIRNEEVSPAPPLDLIGETYMAKTNANVRAAPSNESEVLSVVSTGDTFNAVGRVSDKNWYLISQNDRSIGYVFGDLIQPSVDQEAPELREPVDLDAVELEEGVAVDSVVATTKCRTMVYEVSSDDGTRETDSFEACKASDGAWEL